MMPAHHVPDALPARVTVENDAENCPHPQSSSSELEIAGSLLPNSLPAGTHPDDTVSHWEQDDGFQNLGHQPSDEAASTQITSSTDHLQPNVDGITQDTPASVGQDGSVNEGSETRSHAEEELPSQGGVPKDRFSRHGKMLRRLDLNGTKQVKNKSYVYDLDRDEQLRTDLDLEVRVSEKREMADGVYGKRTLFQRNTASKLTTLRIFRATTMRHVTSQKTHTALFLAFNT